MQERPRQPVRSLQPRLTASVISSNARFTRRIGTSTSFASSVMSRTSLCARASGNSGGSKRWRRNWPPRTSKVPVRPNPPALTASHSASGPIPGLDAGREHLGDQQVHRIPGRVVHQLGDCAGADAPDVQYAGAERLEHRRAPDELLSATAGPQGQGAISRPGWYPGDHAEQGDGYRVQVGALPSPLAQDVVDAKGSVGRVRRDRTPLSDTGALAAVRGRPRAGVRDRPVGGGHDAGGVQVDSSPSRERRRDRPACRRRCGSFPRENLILSSDCGFGRQGLSRLVAFHKAEALAQAAAIVRAELP